MCKHRYLESTKNGKRVIIMPKDGADILKEKRKHARQKYKLFVVRLYPDRVVYTKYNKPYRPWYLKWSLFYIIKYWQAKRFRSELYGKRIRTHILRDSRNLKPCNCLKK